MSPIGYMVLSLLFMVLGAVILWDIRLLVGVMCVVASACVAIRARLVQEGVVDD